MCFVFICNFEIYLILTIQGGNVGNMHRSACERHVILIGIL